MEILESGALGIVGLLVIAFVLSERKRAISPRIVACTFLLQAGVAAFVFLTPFGQSTLATITFGINNVISYTEAGITFMFGPLGDPSGPVGFVVAFRVLPIIVFISSLVAVLYHLKIMTFFIQVVGRGIQLVAGTSKLESVSAAASIFIGMVEAPLTIRPYLAKVTRSQLFAIMSVGLATVTGAILGGYAGLGVSLEYLIPAAFMSAPGGLLMAKILIPETETPHQPNPSEEPPAIDGEHQPANVIEAAANGASTGLMLAANVGALLLAFVALVALLNGIIGGLGSLVGFPSLTLELLLGYAFFPISVLIGIPWNEAVAAGSLLGQKTILNEFVAFASFAEVIDTFSPRAQAAITFALCGFSNLSAMAILLGGLGSMVPDRRSEIAQLGLMAVLAGTLSNLMSAAIVSTILNYTS